MSEEPARPLIGTVLLGVGSNQGDRVRRIEQALGYMMREINLTRISSIYETEPLGVRDQPWFLNLVCMGVTRLRPRALLEFVHEIEASLERVRRERFGPRTIDIDILAYDDLVIFEPDLEIPHPRLSERLFVLEPIAEIAPEWRHPVSGKTAGELIIEGADGAIVRPYSLPPPPAQAPPVT